MKGGGGREACVERSHTAGFSASEFVYNSTEGVGGDCGGGNGGEAGKGGGEGGCEEFLWISVFKTPLFGPGEWGAEGGEDDDVGREFLKDRF